MLNDIVGYSKAMFSTYFYIPSARCLFDAGEGMTLTFAEKCFAIENVFLSHGHQDHISSLVNLLFTRDNAMGDNCKSLKIFYPTGSVGVLNLIEYINKIFHNPQFKLDWIPLLPGQIVQVKQNKYVQAFQNQHIKDELTLGYQLYEDRKTLKKQYVGLSASEIVAAKNLGENIHDSYRYAIFTYSGDTVPLEKYGEYEGGVLAHEITILYHKDLKYNCHTCLENLSHTIRKIKYDILLLYHVSCRYNLDEVLMRIEEFISLDRPVYLLYGDNLCLCQKKKCVKDIV